MTRRMAAILALDAAGYTARMAADRDATLAALRRVFRDVVRPGIAAEDGRVVKLTGDGALAEFPSAAGAVLAAAAIQRALSDDPVRLRAGVHVGDVTMEGGDVFGDAVNIAARLEAAAPEGGVLVSRAAADMAGGGLDVTLEPRGALRLKGVPRPLEALAVALDGARRDAAVADLSAAQEVRFAVSADGTRLAWAAFGEGPTLVKAPNFIQSLDGDLETLQGAYLLDLARHRRVVRFDQRGNGLSDRRPGRLSFEAFVDDLEAVFDAAGVERAPVFGLSQGASIAVAFAARRPERVSGLVLVGGFAKGYAVRDEPRHAELLAALDAMSRVGWDDPYPSMRDHQARLIAPGAAEQDLRDYAEHVRLAIDGDEFERFRGVLAQIDVTGILPQVRCPALVLHAAGERLHPPSQGRALAAGIADARFVRLDSPNHVPVRYDPAWPVALREIDAFLAEVERSSP